MKKQIQLSLAALLAVAMLGFTACGPANPAADAVANSNKSNLQRLVNLYTLHQSKNKYAGPADEAEFKEFIKATDPRRLKQMGVDPDAVDELFVSERDGEKFKIRWGIMSGVHGCSEAAVFEATGKNGNRQVGFLNMLQKEVGAADYDTLMAGGTLPDISVTSSGKSGDTRGGQ